VFSLSRSFGKAKFPTVLIAVGGYSRRYPWNRAPPKSFLWRRDVDKDTRLALLGILELSQEAMKGASETRLLTLKIHEALVKAHVPGYLEAYESRHDHPLPDLRSVISKLVHLVDAGIQALRKICAP
jgi:hypothetical protein